MSNKQWFIVYTKAQVGDMNRYAIEHDLLPFEGFDNEQDWREWHSTVTAYFKERTGVEEKVLAIEPADFLTAYNYREKQT